MVDDAPDRLRPIQPRDLADCRIVLLYAQADRSRVAPLAELIARSGARLDAFTATPDDPFSPGWLAEALRESDRVVLAWSANAAACPRLAGILDASGARYRTRLYVMPVDAVPLPAALRSFRRVRLSRALHALGEGGDAPLPDRLAHRRARLLGLRRRAWTGFIAAAALALGALLIREPPLLRMAFIAPAFLTLGAGVVLFGWAWMDLRYLGQRIALLLADRDLD